MSDLSPTPRTRITRLRERGRTEREDLLAFLSEGLVAHVAVNAGDHPVALPVAYGVDPDGPDEGGTLYVHGSVGATRAVSEAGGLNIVSRMPSGPKMRVRTNSSKLVFDTRETMSASRK